MPSSPAWIPGHHHTETFSAASCDCPVVTMETKLLPRKVGTRPPMALETENVSPGDNCKFLVFSLCHSVFSSRSCVHLCPPLPHLMGGGMRVSTPPDSSQKKGQPYQSGALTLKPDVGQIPQNIAHDAHSSLSSRDGKCVHLLLLLDVFRSRGFLILQTLLILKNSMVAQAYNPERAVAGES